MLNNNDKMVIGASFVRYLTTKTGTHVEFYDVLSRKRRRLNLAKMGNFQIVNLSQRIR